MEKIPESLESAESSGFHEEVAALFDLSTVVDHEHYVETDQKQHELVETNRVKLDEYGCLVNESYSLKLSKSPQKRKELAPDEMKLFDKHILRSAARLCWTR